MSTSPRSATADRRPVHQFTAHDSAVFSLAVSRDGERVLTGSDDRTVRLWEAASGREIARFTFPRRILPRSVSVVGFSGNDRAAFAAESAGSILVFDSALEERVCEIRCPCKSAFFAVVPTTHVAFAGDSDSVLAGWPDGTLRAYAVSGGEELRRVPASQSGVTALALAPRRLLCATASKGGTIRIWNSSLFEEKLRIELGGSNSRFLVRCLSFAPDGSVLFAGATDGLGTLIDYSTQQVLARMGEGWGEVCSAAFSPDGSRIALGTWSSVVHLWDVRGPREVLAIECRRGRRVHAGRIPLAFSSDGRRLLTGDADGVVRFWDLGSL